MTRPGVFTLGESTCNNLRKEINNLRTAHIALSREAVPLLSTVQSVSANLATINTALATLKASAKALRDLIPSKVPGPIKAAVTGARSLLAVADRVIGVVQRALKKIRKKLARADRLAAEIEDLFAWPLKFTLPAKQAVGAVETLCIRLRPQETLLMGLKPNLNDLLYALWAKVDKEFVKGLRSITVRMRALKGEISDYKSRLLKSIGQIEPIAKAMKSLKKYLDPAAEKLKEVVDLVGPVAKKLSGAAEAIGDGISEALDWLSTRRVIGDVVDAARDKFNETMKALKELVEVFEFFASDSVMKMEEVEKVINQIRVLRIRVSQSVNVIDLDVRDELKKMTKTLQETMEAQAKAIDTLLKYASLKKKGEILLPAGLEEIRERLQALSTATPPQRKAKLKEAREAAERRARELDEDSDENDPSLLDWLKGKLKRLGGLLGWEDEASDEQAEERWHYRMAQAQRFMAEMEWQLKHLNPMVKPEDLEGDYFKRLDTSVAEASEIRAQLVQQLDPSEFILEPSEGERIPIDDEIEELEEEIPLPKPLDLKLGPFIDEFLSAYAALEEAQTDLERALVEARLQA